MQIEDKILFEGQECLSHVSLFVHTSLKVFGLPKFGEVKKTVYGACQMGKQTKASHHKVNVIATSWCLELLHVDLMGPTRTESLGGKEIHYGHCG